jgi:NAD-dependent deacetylase
VITQNVDGLHADAARTVAGEGDPAPAIPLELHGSLFLTRCSRCNWRVDRDGSIHGEIDGMTLPLCPQCGSLVRPGVVWFGESLDAAVLVSAVTLARAADVCIVVGTSGVVQPAAGIALETLRSGGSVIDINPDETPLSSIGLWLRGTATALVPRLLDGWRGFSTATTPA